MKNVVFFLLFLLLSRFGYAQRLTFENIGVKSGLPASEVYHVFEDKQGYMWFFTEYGIAKYNGTEFIPVCKNLSVDQSAVYAVTESSEGNIYFANSKGNIYRVFKEKGYRVKSKKLEIIQRFFKKTGLVITSIYFDENGTLWFSTPFESYFIKKNDYYTPSLPSEKLKKTRKPQAFVVRISDKSRKANKLEFNIRDRVRILSSVPYKRSSLKEVEQTISGYGRACIKIKKSVISVGCVSQLFRKKVGTKGKLIDIGGEIIALEIAENGHVWAGTTNGLREFDENLNLVNIYFEDLVVSDVIFDCQGGMWVTTIGFGLFHCSDVKQESYFESIQKNERITLLKKIDDELFIGTYSGKLFVKKGNKIHQIPLAYKVIAVNALLKKNGLFYLGTNTGVFILDMKNWMIPAYQMNIHTNYGIESFDKENLIFISGYRVGSYNVKMRNLNWTGRDSRTREIIKRWNGEILTIRSIGVTVVSLTGQKFPKYLDPLKKASPTKMRLDRHGNVWFCTRAHGLYCLDTKNKLTNLKILPDHVLKNVFFLKDGKVIVATNKGGYISDVGQMNKNSLWKKIIDEEILELEEHQGRIYFGSKVGLFSIEESKFGDKEDYSFYLRSVRSRKKNYALLHVKRFSRDENELYFDFDFLNYKQKRRVINYTLNGPITQKGVVSGTTLHLQNLIPGTYKLQVSPDIMNGEKKDVKITKYFSIEPAIWETLTFRIIFFLLSMIIVLLLYRFFANRQSKRKTAREAIEKQLNEYRLTALKSQINPHFMSNSLVAIQNLILQNETDNANLYLAKFSLLLRTLLDYSSKSYASLKNELSLVELYVELEQLRFSNKFSFEVDIDEEVDVEEIMIPTLVTQPFVENAIWHGLLPLKNHESAILKLKIFFELENFVLSIIDNGVGRNFQGKAKSDRQSKGTELIVNRIETINQLYQTTGGKIEIIDLFEDGQASGTRVNIILPKDMLDQLNEKY